MQHNKQLTVYYFEKMFQVCHPTKAQMMQVDILSNTCFISYTIKLMLAHSVLCSLRIKLHAWVYVYIYYSIWMVLNSIEHLCQARVTVPPQVASYKIFKTLFASPTLIWGGVCNLPKSRKGRIANRFFIVQI